MEVVLPHNVVIFYKLHAVREHRTSQMSAFSYTLKKYEVFCNTSTGDPHIQ